eukprot:6176250-Pleurochrysis_carterae.AAC.1
MYSDWARSNLSDRDAICPIEIQSVQSRSNLSSRDPIDPLEMRSGRSRCDLAESGPIWRAISHRLLSRRCSSEARRKCS